MKIELNASRELDRQIGLMCVRCEVEQTLIQYHTERLIGAYGSYFQVKSLVTKDLVDKLGVVQIHEVKSITIDLSKVELDLRLAIGTPIRFVEGIDLLDAVVDGVNLDDFNKKLEVTLMDSMNHIWIATEEIKLSADWLRENGIKIVEES